jgi:O-succinylbenzoic acid--CoA ligase
MLLDALRHRNQGDWLIGLDKFELQEKTEQLYIELTALTQLSEFTKTGIRRRVIISDRSPLTFLAKFLAAISAGCQVFLCNPDWGIQEWQEVLELVKPNPTDIFWVEVNSNIPSLQILDKSEEKSIPLSPVLLEKELDVREKSIPVSSILKESLGVEVGVGEILPLIMIPTGGSSGKIKFVMHSWETLTASVKGFTEYFQLKQVHSFCVLPLYHVSGLMQFIRSFTTDGKFLTIPFKTLEASPVLPISLDDCGDFLISLVPTQLQRLLENLIFTESLSKFKAILLGGAPPWDELLERASYYQIPIALTYGMTETASGIVALKPEDFIQGKANSLGLLPHANIKIRNSLGHVLNINEIGNITIQAKSLAIGYFPNKWVNMDYFTVDDLGYFDDQGYIHIVGRNSDKIITGGENVYPIEVESAIRNTGMVKDVSVMGIPDSYWGQAVTAIYIPQNPDDNSDGDNYWSIKLLLQQKISNYKIPKYWIAVEKIPRNNQGKINTQELHQIVDTFLNLSI